VAGASFVCSAREVVGLLEASVKRSSELMVCRSSAPFDLASVRYLKPPLEGCLAVDESGGHGEGGGEGAVPRGPLTVAVLFALSRVPNDNPDESLIVSLLPPSPLFSLSFCILSPSTLCCRCLGRW
jgi:hypothetical protein